MSIDVMTKIMQRCTLTGSQRLAMLVMGNWCDDDGDSLYPSVELVGEAMQISRSQAQRVIRSLMPESAEAETTGEWWVRVIGNSEGGAPGTTRRYQLNVARLDALPKLPAFERADQRRRERAETGRMDATRHGKTGRAAAARKVGDRGRIHAARLVRRLISRERVRARGRSIRRGLSTMANVRLRQSAGRLHGMAEAG